jgi:diguanylate cyclase (GGDEF)-like protein/putative nucleotidyltransferase with HDIG domain
VRQAESLLSRLFSWAITAAGALVLAYALFRLYRVPLSLDWSLTLALVVLINWRVQAWVPGVRSSTALTDAFIYLSAIMLGPWAAVALASIDGLIQSPRRLTRRLGINVAAMNTAILTATLAAMALFGPLDLLVDAGVIRLALALGVIAVVNYFIHSSIHAVALALEKRTSPARMWAENHLWTAPAFIAGAVAAGIIARAIAVFGFHSFVISIPILAFTYVICRVYLRKVEKSNEHIEKLTRLHLATIESLTMAIDAKDPAARGHILRVRVLAEGLARACDYPEDQMEGLKAAALLHDVGKLAVPEHILSKPGRLSPAEFKKIMVHPVVGADILSNVEFPYEVVPIVKHHHEKFDGTGYPDGLAGEQIPFGARILTVVDCYEALTTQRTYRPRYPRDEALELMRKESGLTFDPVILSTFIESIKTIEKTMPPESEPPILFEGVGFKAVEPSAARTFGLEPTTATEKALLDIATAQREVLSLYEIAQTLGSTLKLSEVLPIVATKLEHVTSFTTLVIFLLDADRLRAAHVIGEHSSRLKSLEMECGVGASGWVAEHRKPLIGGSPRSDLEKPLGPLATMYNSATILPLSYRDELVGTIALYCEEERGHSADEVRMLEAIAIHAAAAIHNALTFERTKESALTDSLTGLPNSRYMYSFFDQERSRAHRHGYPLVLMMMDIDGFKRVNDTYGHHIGDEILRQVAAMARSQLRSGDTLIRYAGDEFVAVLHRATPETVIELKARLQSSIDSFAHEVRPGKVARVGISIGHATYGADGTAIDELMEVADQRMYQDKLCRKGGPQALSLVAHHLGPAGL